jgi:hypothetical protein
VIPDVLIEERARCVTTIWWPYLGAGGSRTTP